MWRNVTQPARLSIKPPRSSPEAFMKTKEPWEKKEGFYRDKSRVRRGGGKVFLTEERGLRGVHGDPQRNLSCSTYS